MPISAGSLPIIDFKPSAEEQRLQCSGVETPGDPIDELPTCYCTASIDSRGTSPARVYVLNKFGSHASVGRVLSWLTRTAKSDDGADSATDRSNSCKTARLNGYLTSPPSHDDSGQETSGKDHGIEIGSSEI